MNASQVLTKRNPQKLEIAILKKSWFQTKLNRTGGKMIFSPKLEFSGKACFRKDLKQEEDTQVLV